ncbi:MFP1 attachment factor 1-like [Cucumis melo var. makuwa]|uniref:MFP1 attachment factor 1-like n=2 Tax=Cucumis melo TaxID=3656 RepID=A0A5A7V8G3_CUCMM|nr:MFP1 attachment factor 1-like [Cucumis melo var. makuwa]TYK20164.1 MFP1 attachment factor 1-like [Cucumis melo var. makuwa]
MSDPQIAAGTPTEHDSPTPPTDSQVGDQAKESTKSPKSFNTSFSIWPPSQRTRDAVVKRLIETLSNPSVLSKRYGTVPQEEAAEAARLIEEEAYSFAAGKASADDDGIEILQLYSREISKRTLETVKARAASDSTAENGSSPPVVSTTTNEETPSVEQS